MTLTRTQQGLAALDEMFNAARAQNRAAFLPYFPIGYPTYDESIDALEAMAAEGVDGFEIGIPFSDPIADGPAIQMATQIALDNGVTVRRCLDAVATLRARGVAQPMMMMATPTRCLPTERNASCKMRVLLARMASSSLICRLRKRTTSAQRVKRLGWRRCSCSRRPAMTAASTLWPAAPRALSTWSR